MLNLLEVTTLLKDNGINAVAKILKIKKVEIYDFLKSNGLMYQDGEVKPIINNNHEIAITKVIQKNKPSNSNTSQVILQKDNKDINIENLKELVSFIEPIRELIQEYNNRKNLIEIKKPEIKVRNITEIKQKLFKVDTDVLKDWEEFVAVNKQYKVQSLISLALAEFIKKYK